MNHFANTSVLNWRSQNEFTQSNCELTCLRLNKNISRNVFKMWENLAALKKPECAWKIIQDYKIIYSAYATLFLAIYIEIINFKLEYIGIYCN